MKQLLLWSLTFCVVVVLIIPTIIVKGFNFIAPPEPQNTTMINVYINSLKKNLRMPLEEYVKGVVAAEMPAEFEPEALKAQAVVARTFVLKRLKARGETGCTKHEKADVCDDFKHCQAFVSKDEMKKKWGYFGYLKYWRKISSAVNDTKGIVAAYDGQLIDPAYHSTSAGPTENSEDVWSGTVPYLRSVECDYDRHSPYYSEKKTMTIKTVEKLLGVSIPKVAAASAGADMKVIQALSVSTNGRAKNFLIGGKMFSGNEIRERLGLRSTKIDWSIAGDKLIFKTSGYGHGVGMCQYGADGMARQGNSYIDILKYYYTGIEVGDSGY